MAQKLVGVFTLRQMIYLTKKNAQTRFIYKKRDVLKKILIKNIIHLHPDRMSKPNRRLEILTFSYPQYGNYLKYTDYSKQRKFRHEYDNILAVEADENGKFSVDSTKWKYRLGSEKVPKKSINQSLVKTIFRETSAKWKKELAKKYNVEKVKGDSKKVKELLKKQKDEYKRKVDLHIKNAKYVDLGDFWSKEQGINADFIFRVAPVLQVYGHLYGKNQMKIIPKNSSKPFLPKHALNLIEQLIKKGILLW